MRKPFDPDALLAAIARGERSCGDFQMRIARDGTWYYQGTPIRRLELVKLFATVLRRGPDGRHWLVTPVEQGRDRGRGRAVRRGRAARGRRRARRSGSACGPISTSGWPSDAAHPLEMRPQPDGSRAPYVRVRDSLDARVTRSAFYHLVELAEAAPDGVEEVGVWSGGRFFPLGTVDD